MSIINVKEDWEKFSVIRSPAKLAAARGFTVVFDNKNNPIQRPLLALEAAGVPHYNDYHPYNSWLYVDNKTVTAKSPILFEVLVHYTSADIEDNQNRPIAPWDEKPAIRWGTVVSNEKIDKDINGKPILNSAKQSPDPPITEDFYDTTLTISENKKTFDDTTAANFKNKVNSNTFFGKPAGSVLCTDYACEEAWFGKEKYYKITKEFRIRMPELPGVKGWTRRILDEGFMVLDGSDDKNVKLGAADKSKRIIDNVTDKNPVSEPQLLDGKGQLLPPSAAGTPQKGVYLTYETKKAVSFSSLA